METLIVNKAKKEDLELLVTLGKKMGMSISIAPKKKVALIKKSVAVKKKEADDEKFIMELSKKINKAATKRMFAVHGIPYPDDSNN